MAKSPAALKSSTRKPMGQRIKEFVIDFKHQWELQSMIIPGIIFMIIFCYIPIYGLTIAFKNYTVVDTLSSARWVGLDNFKIIFSDKYFWDSVVNTLGISFLKLAIGFVIPIILAIMIYELNTGRFKKIVQTISYLPHFLSWIVLGGMLITWFSTSGLFNQILMNLHIISKPSNILLDSSKYWFIATLSDIWKEAGWGTILYLAIMSKIDPTYYEAAKIDGANRIRQIWMSASKGKEYIAIDGPQSTVGNQPVLNQSGITGWMNSFITKSCKDPAKAIQIFTYLLSDEGQMLMNYGIEGETYQSVGDGKYEFMPAVKELQLNDADKFKKEYRMGEFMFFGHDRYKL